MPYRPEAELKRPDLKGEFLCGHCGKTFCHAASLNRHRLNFHGDDQMCQICNVKIAAHETVRRHMSLNHQITRVFTCGCCNWTFPDKKELHAHNNSMMRTGQPGEARAIAISNRTPGSLAQAELRPEEASPMAPRTVYHSPPTKPVVIKKKVENNNMAEMIYKQVLNQQAPMFAGFNPEFMQALLLNNPNFLPLLSMLQPQIDLRNNAKQEEASTSDYLLAVNTNNNNNNINSQHKYEELQVKTETEEVSSGPESGICSGEDVTDNSPVPSDSSKESTPPYDSAVKSRKRKSVDAIASFLFQRKQCTPTPLPEEPEPVEE